MSKFKYVINGNPYEVSIDSFEGVTATVTVNGVTYEVNIERERRAPQRVERPKVVAGEGPQPPRMKPQAGLGEVKAPLPGVIKDVKVTSGVAVKQGQIVCILEAMKMENEIYATTDGTISRVNVAAGQSVLEGDVLVEIGA